MKYLMFIRSAEKYRDIPPPAALKEAMSTFVEDARRNGTLVDTGGLLPSKDGALVRLAKGELIVIDGPFTEAKEVIGGWAILELPTKQDAVRSAQQFMELHRIHWPGFDAECELRPMYEPGAGC